MDKNRLIDIADYLAGEFESTYGREPTHEEMADIHNQAIEEYIGRYMNPDCVMYLHEAG